MTTGDQSASMKADRFSGNHTAIDEAYFDDESKKLIVSLANGVICAVPVTCIQALATVSQSELNDVVISENAQGLRWPIRGLEISLSEIIFGAIHLPV